MIERLFSALTDNSLAHQCVDVQESLLHQMYLSGGWACLWVRGVILMEVGHPKKDIFVTHPSQSVSL